MNKSTLFQALAAGLGAWAFSEYGMRFVPGSVSGAAGGKVGDIGGPVLGAWLGLVALSFVK